MLGRRRHECRSVSHPETSGGRWLPLNPHRLPANRKYTSSTCHRGFEKQSLEGNQDWCIRRTVAHRQFVYRSTRARCRRARKRSIAPTILFFLSWRAGVKILLMEANPPARLPPIASPMADTFGGIGKWSALAGGPIWAANKFSHDPRTSGATSSLRAPPRPLTDERQMDVSFQYEIDSGEPLRGYSQGRAGAMHWLTLIAGGTV